MKRGWLVSLIVIIALLLMTLPVDAAAPGEPPGLEKAIAAQEKHNPELLMKDGVVGTAVGLENGNPVIQVLTERAGVAGIPASLEGIPVQVLVTGKITAIGPAAKGPKGGGLSTTDVWPRPVPIGVSTGNVGECSAGTISARVIHGTKVYALSNNHVYALENSAPIGSEVLQPGLYDTGCIPNEANVIGTLADFVPIKFDGTANYVDAAIALSSTVNLGNATPPNGYGIPKSNTVDAALMMAVQKYGRTTQLTKGTITGVNATVTVGYSSGSALFTGQIIVQSNKPFIKAGDSGSLLVDNSNEPVGLLFAGNNAGNYAVANSIDAVLAAFGVTIDGNQ